MLRSAGAWQGTCACDFPLERLGRTKSGDYRLCGRGSISLPGSFVEDMTTGRLEGTIRLGVSVGHWDRDPICQWEFSPSRHQLGTHHGKVEVVAMRCSVHCAGCGGGWCIGD